MTYCPMRNQRNNLTKRFGSPVRTSVVFCGGAASGEILDSFTKALHELLGRVPTSPEIYGHKDLSNNKDNCQQGVLIHATNV